MKAPYGFAFALMAAALIWLVPDAHSQSAASTEEQVRDEFLDHFRQSSMKMTALSDAIPADLYSWSPGEGVMSIARVYAHIARYNYYYLESSLGIATPKGVDLDSMEDLTDKAKIRELLVASVEHVNKNVASMTRDQLGKTVRLYGQDVAGWEVLLQLIAHMNEHVGQSVAYARINGVEPPWSR